MKDIQLCIFDMDGLMIDSERVTKSAYSQVCTEMGLSMTKKMYLTLVGRNVQASSALLKEYFPGVNIPLLREQVNKKKDDIYAREGLQVKKGLYLLFDYLERRGIKRFVATSTAKVKAEKLLRKANVHHRLDGMVFGDEVNNSKPAPDIFLKALELSDVPAQHALVLEDSYNGILAANNAAIPVIMIPDLLPPRADLYTRAVFDNLEKVITYLEQESSCIVKNRLS